MCFKIEKIRRNLIGLEIESIEISEVNDFIVDGKENKILNVFDHPNCGVTTIQVEDAQGSIHYLPSEDVGIEIFQFNTGISHFENQDCYCADCIISNSGYILDKGSPQGDCKTDSVGIYNVDPLPVEYDARTFMNWYCEITGTKKW